MGMNEQDKQLIRAARDKFRAEVLDKLVASGLPFHEYEHGDFVVNGADLSITGFGVKLTLHDISISRAIEILQGE